MNDPLHPGPELVLMIVFAAVFFQAGRMENRSGLLTGALSILTWLVTSWLWEGSLVANLTGQGVFFLAWTVFNLTRKRKPPVVR